MSSLGENIKIYRKQKGMTQKDLAKALQLAEITIRQYENNKRQPKIYLIEKIAAVLNVSFTDLMEFNTFAAPVFYEKKSSNEIKSPNEMDEDFCKRLTAYKAYILQNIDKLNTLGQAKAAEQIELLTKMPEYKKDQQ